jgi:hypothetical protein
MWAKLLIKERALYGTVEEPEDIPQTLPEGVRSFCASKKSKLLTNKPLQCGAKGKLKSAKKSLTWIRQYCWPIFEINLKRFGEDGSAASLYQQNLACTDGALIRTIKNGKNGGGQNLKKDL